MGLQNNHGYQDIFLKSKVIKLTGAKEVNTLSRPVQIHFNLL